MKVQWDHLVLSSFYLWFDDQVVKGADAVTTGISQTFTYSTLGTDVPSNLVAYYAPDRQLVANGTGVPSGVYVDSVWVDQGTNNLMIDFDQGRVLMDSTEGTALNVSGDFDRKDVNVYITNQSEEEIIVNTDFTLASDGDTWLQNADQLGQDNYTIPAAFISYNSSMNTPYAFGGEDNTTSVIRVVVIAEENYTLDGMLSYFRDRVRTCITMFSYDDFPFGEYFHIKNPPYSYDALVASKPNNKKAFLEKVTASKMYDRSTLRLHKDLLIGFLDFEVSNIRYPRISPTQV